MFSKLFRKKLNKENYELIESFHSHRWVEGVYAAYPIEGKDKDIPLYIGESDDIGRRCWKDHQKPSQHLLEDVVLGYRKGGMWVTNDQFQEYRKKAIKARENIEFRLLAVENGGKWKREGIEGYFIKELNPKFNRRK